MSQKSTSETRMDKYLDKYLDYKDKKDNKSDTSKGGDTLPRIAGEPTPKTYTSIKFVWLDGKREAFSYAYMTNLKFLALETSNQITATFTTHKVTITGFCLLELFEDMDNRYVKTVEQMDANYTHLIDDEMPMVTEIEVKSFH